ncbi:hypothetical protein GCM10009630_60760 [Kribbella jejuensis]|uniref:Uncharacterized protein n=1 Tax=Kribbella jejuensis TaxID=236068 RepID=A0A542EPL5_9ACTN|nr:hypothetical protein [Kribbella jejuensis]TQJ17194.1 hypothetical protein FB475_1308 [Kribbella jejuensis]
MTDASPKPGGLDLQAVVKELTEIGKAEKYLDGGPGEARARELGRQLHAHGGIASMRAAIAEVASRLPDPVVADELEYAWDGTGSWLA